MSKQPVCPWYGGTSCDLCEQERQKRAALKAKRRAAFKRAAMSWLGAFGRATLGWLAMAAIAAFFYGFVVALINWPEVVLVVIFVVGFVSSVWAAKR